MPLALHPYALPGVISSAAIACGFLLSFVAGGIVSRRKNRDCDKEGCSHSLAARELRYRVLLDQAPDIFYLTDPDGVVLDANAASERLTGYSLAELAGTNIVGLFPTEQKPAAEALLENARGGNAKPPTPFRVRKRDGALVSLEAKAQVSSIAGERVLVLQLQDVTARDHERQVLRESERRFRDLLENIHVIAVTLDVDGRITYTNPYLLELSGWTMEEVLGRSWFEVFVPAGESAALRQVFHNCAQGGDFPGHFRSPIVTRSGARRMISWSNTVLRDTGGSVIGCAGIGKDLTEILAIEEHRVDVQRLESLGRLAGGVAHDFNNLLTVINGYTQVLLPHFQGDPFREELLYIDQAGRQAADLTRQLLAFSRKEIIDPKPINLRAVASRAETLLSRVIGETVTLETSLSPVPAVIADEGQMHQLLMNLAANARDAMPFGGRLRIQTSVAEFTPPATAEGTPAGGQYVLLEISDTSRGMDEQTRKHLFEPFFATKTGGGTGLGLATVYATVTRAGGYIQVESEPDKGTRFRIHLPAAAENAAEIVEAPEPSTEALTGGAETILLVEDDDRLRLLAHRVLKDCGYHVVPAGQADEAMDHIGPGKPRIDLLVTDVVMPGKNGRELAHLVRAASPDTKVLFMSGYTEDALSSCGAREPGISFLEKPFTPGTLAHAVRSTLDALLPATILVADDEEGVRSFLRSVLEKAGYVVIEAGDGNQALALLGHTRVDLVITDLAMPEKEGIETIQQLGRLPTPVKIIAMSGAFGPALLEAARNLGACASFSKPIHPNDLVATVSRVLRRG